MTAATVLTVAADEAGVRLDRWFRRHFPDIPHGRLEKLLRTGQVRVDGKRTRAGARLAAGQQVRVPPAARAAPGETPGPWVAVRPAIPARLLDELVAAVIHRDDDLLAINKPAGLAVQGGSGTHVHVDAMLDALRLGAAERPRLVHRLDKDTSGVLVLARHAAAAAVLAEAFRSREAKKLYWAIVAGVPRPAAGRIDLPIGKVAGRMGERVVAGDEGKRAATLYRVIERAGGRAAWVALAPLTGRTHQLRVHMAAIGTPILGDGKYGGRAAFLAVADIARRVHLHARAIRLPRPRGGEITLTAPAPAHFLRALAALGLDEGAADDAFLS